MIYASCPLEWVAQYLLRYYQNYSAYKSPLQQFLHRSIDRKKLASLYWAHLVKSFLPYHQQVPTQLYYAAKKDIQAIDLDLRFDGKQHNLRYKLDALFVTTRF